MHSPKFSIFSVLLISAFTFSVNFVLGANSLAPKNIIPVPVSRPILVSEVNLGDAKIVSQKGNVFNIAFSIENGVGVQTGVKYGTELVPDGGNYVADEKVYDESLTLYEHSTVKKEITYTAPAVLSGIYNLYITSSNESSFPFGKISLGKVKLNASVKGVQILNDSCYLQIVGEKGAPHYALMQDVSISSANQLKLTCSAVNGADIPVTVTPSFETRQLSAYGKLAEQSAGDTTPITFLKNEKKTLAILLPKATTSAPYDLRVSLISSEFSSNTVSLHYAIQGASATISKISLDKDYYQGGDKGEISLLWFTSGNGSQISINANITDDKGALCADKISEPLVRDFANPITTIPFKINSNCLSPKVSASISDEKGNMLDQKDFAFKSTPENEKKSKASNNTLLLVIIVLLAIIGLGAYMKKKKNSKVNI